MSVWSDVSHRVSLLSVVVMCHLRKLLLLDIRFLANVSQQLNKIHCLEVLHLLDNALCFHCYSVSLHPSQLDCSSWYFQFSEDFNTAWFDSVLAAGNHIS